LRTATWRTPKNEAGWTSAWLEVNANDRTMSIPENPSSYIEHYAKQT
jgi:hypothetical protein